MGRLKGVLWPTLLACLSAYYFKSQFFGQREFDEQVLFWPIGLLLGWFTLSAATNLWQMSKESRTLVTKFMVALFFVVGWLPTIPPNFAPFLFINASLNSAAQILPAQQRNIEYYVKEYTGAIRERSAYLYASIGSTHYKISLSRLPNVGFDIYNFSTPAVLYSTPNENEFVLELYGLLNVRQYSLDLTNSSATLIADVATNSGSCAIPTEQYKQFCTFVGDKLYFDEADNKRYINFGVYNALDSHNEVVQYKFIHLALGGDNNYFLPFGDPNDPLPILDKSKLENWGKILSVKGELLTVETFNRAGRHKLFINVERKTLTEARN